MIVLTVSPSIFCSVITLRTCITAWCSTFLQCPVKVVICILVPLAECSSIEVTVSWSTIRDKFNYNIINNNNNNNNNNNSKLLKLFFKHHLRKQRHCWWQFQKAPNQGDIFSKTRLGLNLDHFGVQRKGAGVQIFGSPARLKKKKRTTCTIFSTEKLVWLYWFDFAISVSRCIVLDLLINLDSGNWGIFE